MKFYNLKYCFFLLFAAGTLTAHAQGNLMKRADEKYEDYKYFEAIELYKDAIEKKKKGGKDAYANLADCYYKTSQYRQAAHWFKKAANSFPNKHEYKFNYAQALMSNGEYDEALETFKKYQQKNSSDKRTSHFIKWCKNIDVYLADSSKYQVKKLPFNSKAHEFSPTFYKGGLVFTSDRKDRNSSSAGQDEIYTDLYFVEHNFGKRWTDVAILDGKIQGKYHEGQAVFAENGDKMYFNRNVRKGKRNRKSKKSTSVLKIYEATWKNGKWDNVKELPFNSKDNSYSVSHPAISKDGRTMVFTSNRPGGKGGMDLYMVRKSGNSWGMPKNLGTKVNTAGNEVFPTIHDDGTVYFSSNGWGGFGGLDIFSTKVKNGRWADAKNVGFPINSPNDDSGLMLIPSKQIGYFASNRKGGKGFDDVYELFIEETKAIELLEDKNLVEAPSPIRSSKSAVRKVQAEEKEEMPVEIEEEALAEIKEEKMASKATDGDEGGKFSPKEEVNTFIPKKDDVQIGKVFYLIGSVIEYGKNSNVIKNAVVEVLDHTNNSKAVHYADKEGNFYMNLEKGHDYTIVHTSKGEIHDFKKIDTKKKASSEVTHIVLRGKKPSKLQEYVSKIYKRDVKFEAKETEKIARKAPVTKVVETVNVAPTTNYASSPTYFDYPTSNITEVTYKVQLGAFKRNLSTRSSFFREVNDIVDKENGPNEVKRYVVGNYADYYTARGKSQELQNNGFDKAFVAIYINGIRQERDTHNMLKEMGITP